MPFFSGRGKELIHGSDKVKSRFRTSLFGALHQWHRGFRDAPVNGGDMKQPTSSRAALKTILGGRGEVSRVWRIALCFTRSNAFFRSNRTMVRGCCHSRASSINLEITYRISLACRDLRKPAWCSEIRGSRVGVIWARSHLLYSFCSWLMRAIALCLSRVRAPGSLGKRMARARFQPSGREVGL